MVIDDCSKDETYNYLKQIANQSEIQLKLWGNFYKNWMKEHKHINPIKRIRKEFYKDAIITDCEGAYILNIFGKLFKLKKL